MRSYNQKTLELLGFETNDERYASPSSVRQQIQENIDTMIDQLSSEIDEFELHSLPNEGGDVNGIEKEEHFIDEPASGERTLDEIAVTLIDL